MPDRVASPLARKLGVANGSRLALLFAPAGWTIDELPAGVTMVRRRSAVRADVVVAFCRDLATLRRSIEGLTRSIVPDGSLWIAWPRRAGGHGSDLTDNRVRGAVLPLGLVDVKVAALDDDWSALKFVWRAARRERLA